jgi:catechol 2,3-dioxygenase-like lactoylglutathione lyase family enzyme
MPIAAFKDICMDATDALAQARFWSAALGAPLVDLGDGSARLDPPPGGSPAETLWIDPVPEPRTVKTRVHLDLRADPQPLIAAGATVVSEPGRDHWWLLADPEGNQFCAFPPEDGQPLGVFELIVDAGDAVAQATWWARITGGTVHTTDRGDWAWVEDAAGFPWQSWVFNPVPEAKAAKNRLHWDVRLAGSGPDALVGAGARIVRAPDDVISWWIMADPEGNEFCAFAGKPE